MGSGLQGIDLQRDDLQGLGLQCEEQRLPPSVFDETLERFPSLAFASQHLRDAAPSLQVHLGTSINRLSSVGRHDARPVRASARPNIRFPSCYDSGE